LSGAPFRAFIRLAGRVRLSRARAAQGSAQWRAWENASATAVSFIMMSTRRMFIVYLLLAFIVGGHAYAVYRDVEYWPFSPYPMFRWIVEPQTRFSELWGVPRGQPDKEIELYDEYVPTLPGHRIQRQFIKYAKAGDAKKLHAMVDEWMQQYEANRRAGRHNGPELETLRVYEFTYTLKPGATNMGTPDERKLLWQVSVNDRNAVNEAPNEAPNAGATKMQAATEPAGGGGDQRDND
jgi:hypothetical protein